MSSSVSSPPAKDTATMSSATPQQDYGWDSSLPTNSVEYCLSAIKRVLAEHGCQSVLDVGCGNGAMSGRLNALGFNITAIEPDQQGFEIAKNNHPDVDFHHLGVYDDTPQLGTYDAIVSSEVIEHLYDPAALLRLASRHLNKSGILVLTCPYYGYTKNLLLSLTNRWDDHHQPSRVGGHIKLWSHETMRAFLLSEGFDALKLSGAGRFWPFWASMLVVARKRPEMSR
ncbi:MAG: class I SAM-dependent methyltransferase [Rhodopirellula sp. JB044]|uniref:class I SAM-dependent methyltransferase n=1 Tax=Rhodopirellula sp. JB044 TaxID=3342844 RepID=UPI00370C6C6A